MDFRVDFLVAMVVGVAMYMVDILWKYKGEGGKFLYGRHEREFVLENDSWKKVSDLTFRQIRVIRLTSIRRLKQSLFLLSS